MLNREELSRVTAVTDLQFLVLTGLLRADRHGADAPSRRLPLCPAGRRVPGVLIGALILLWGIQAAVGIAFVVLVSGSSARGCLLALIGFLVTGGIWLACVFLSALKNFTAISLAFALGMLVRLRREHFCHHFTASTGALAGLTLGLAVIFYVLLGCILAEYPYGIRNPLSFCPSFRKYWDLACIGLFYNAAIWVDKWVMWLSPDGQSVAPGLIAIRPMTARCSWPI